MTTPIATRAFDEGPVVLDFGRYEGCSLDEVPESYCKWLLTQRWIASTLREAVQVRLDIDRPEDDIQPAPDSAGVAFPLIVWKWQQAMRAAFSSDSSALLVVERGLTELKGLCSEYTNRPWLPEGGAA